MTSTLPTTRTEFRDFILRRLGEPVIELNIDEDQAWNRIDEALAYFQEYHFDGSEKTYYTHKLTQTDIDNKYLDLPANVIGAVKLFPLSNVYNTANMFGIRYQIALNDLYTLTAQSMVPYYMAIMHLQFLEEILVGRQPIRYNRLNNRFYVDMDWNTVSINDYVVVECYAKIDPDTNPKIWQDRWLIRYATALMGMQWGRNLTKYKYAKLAGGIEYNGQEIYERYEREKIDLEKEMQTSYTLPATDMIG